MISIIAALILWSSLGIIIKESGLSPIALIFFPCACSLIPLACILTSRSRQFPMPDREALGIIALLGLVSLINTGCFFYSYQYTSIANAVLAHYTAPGFVAMLAPFLLREHLTKAAVGAVALAACGLWIMLGVDAGTFARDLLSGDRNSLGLLFGVVSGLAYAFVIIIIRKTASTIDPLVMTFGQNLIISVLLLPLAELPSPTFPAAWLFPVVGIVHSTLAPILYFRGMRTVNANKAAILGYCEPVCAILLGAIVLGEMIGMHTALGGVMILASGYLARKL